MSAINTVNSATTLRPDAATRAQSARTAPAATPRAAQADTVELSAEALASSEPIRTDLVNRVRGEIAAGTYETPERLDQAAEALARELGLA
ncbi:MAG: flagellar biosynthesis anti-sigma factor FlgM [Phycisphaerales bacterium]|nr:flagellar biosynthesis anti-sigma factor FlgM [Phycisphaerales bacterium]